MDFEQQWSSAQPTANSSAASNAALPHPRPLHQGPARPRDGGGPHCDRDQPRPARLQYVWGAAKHDHFDGVAGPPDEALSYTSIFFPTEAFESSLSDPGPGKQDDSGQDVPLRAPGVVPVLSAPQPFCRATTTSSWKKKAVATWS